MNPGPRISLALSSLYNLKSAHPRQVHAQNEAISPLSSVQATLFDDEKQAIMFSPATTATTTVAYFPDNKIVLPIEEGLEAPPRRASAANGLEVASNPTGEPPQYTSPHAEAELPDQPQWKTLE